jgi:hypothetical protein
MFKNLPTSVAIQAEASLEQIELKPAARPASTRPVEFASIDADTSKGITRSGVKKRT